MTPDGLNDIASPISDSDLSRMAEYGRTRTKTFITLWTPDQVLAQRFAEVAGELLRLRACSAWCDRMMTAPEVTPATSILSNRANFRWRVPYYVNGVLTYGPEAATPSEAIWAAMTQAA